MATFDMSAIMDALAEKCIQEVTPRAYAWPTESITVPCVVIGYPTEIDYDSTMYRGSDRALFPVFYIVGKASDRNSRDDISVVISGPMKDALDGTLDGAVNECSVMGCSVTEITVNSVAYLAAKFDIEIYS
jgi:hypothetical protein